jgi:hypothetical protein
MAQEYPGKKFSKKLTSEQRFSASWEMDKNGCWNWLGSLSPSGYGRITAMGKKLRAHRYSWMLTSEHDIPAGMVVCHSCDNRKCVNPDHLFLGTVADNVADCVSKGRHARGEKLSHPRAAGEKNGNSRLTVRQVNAIRADERSQRKIATRFGVSQPLISKIKRGEIWK